MHCIGTDADNIRPAQRALQMFKNQTFLALLFGTGPISLSSPSTPDAKNGSNSSTRTPPAAIEAAESMRCLMPALFRGGTLCWNPTVNKMIGLAINNLRVRSSNTFSAGGCLLCCLLCCLLYCLSFSLLSPQHFRLRMKKFLPVCATASLDPPAAGVRAVPSQVAVAERLRRPKRYPL